MILFSQHIKQNDYRKGDFNGMSKEQGEYLQCCNCGNIHIQQIQCNDDDLYVNNIKCNKCKQTGRHLRCGDDPSDVYMYYDVVLDRRYY